MHQPGHARRSWKRILWRALIAVPAIGVLAIGLLLASLSIEHNSAIELPTPTGAFPVGRAANVWTDHSYADPLAPVPAKRELPVWLWYPAAQAGAADDYLPVTLRQQIEQARGTLISQFLTRDLSKVRAHSSRSAAVSPTQPSYPVVIMRAGASSEVLNYSSLAEDLASHGYIVVGFDAPYRTNIVTFPDGRVIRRTRENNPEICVERTLAEQAGCMDKLLNAWTADTAFVLDRLERLNTADPAGLLAGRVDLARVGMFGHSFGGATAAQFCHDDRRCKAGIDVDGQLFGTVVTAGLHQPFMFLMSDHGSASDPVTRHIVAKIQSVYDRLPPDARHHVTIRGANHFTFSDDGALLKSHIVVGALRALGILGIEGRRQLAVTSHCVRAFFDAYLKGTGEARLTIGSPLYPELEVLQ